MATFNVNVGEAGLTIKALRRNYNDRSKVWTGAAYVAIAGLTDAQYLAAMVSLTPISTSENATGSYLLTITDATEREWIEVYNNPTGITDVPFAVQDYEPRTDLNTIDGIVDAILADTGTDGVVVATASKTGYSLAATGLDSITATEPSGKPTTFPGWIMWLVQRFRRSAKTTTTLTTLTEAGATITTQAITDDGAGTETLGEPS